MSDGIVVTMVLYGCKAWVLGDKVWKRENVLENKCLRTICCVRRVNKSKK